MKPARHTRRLMSPPLSVPAWIRPGVFRFGIWSLWVWRAGRLAAAEGSGESGVDSMPVPEIGPSLVRVVGALVMVLGLFLAGVWLYRRWQSLPTSPHRRSLLQVVEAKSLGNRQTLLVVGYHDQRFLLATSPAGIAYLTALPAQRETEEPAAPPPRFQSALDHATRNPS